MPTGAIFSPCRNYRYLLWRTWDKSRAPVLFIGLNPSTADEQHNDPTIRRCTGFAQRWGYGGAYVTNLFAWRTSYPHILKTVPEPVGKETDDWILQISQQTHCVVGCWGNHGGWGDRHRSVLSLLPRLYCLKITKQGYPAHPLYLPSTLKPIIFR